MVALGVLHLLVLGENALGEVPGLLRLDMWSTDHLKAFALQTPAILLGGAAFWSTVGSFAVPLILLGLLVVELDRRGQPLPAFIGWGLGLWAALSSLLVEPSGFPLGLPIAACLALGARRQGRA